MKAMKNTMKCFIAVFVMAMAFVMTGITVEAIGVTQVAQDKTSVTINWEPDSDATEYYVGYGADYSAAKAMAEAKTITLPATTTSYTISGLSPATNYKVYVYYSYAGYSGKVYTSSLGSQTIVTLPTKVTGLNQTKWWYYIENVDFAWNEQPAANYEVKIMNHKGKVLKKLETYGNQSGYDDVKNNQTYQAQICIYYEKTPLSLMKKY